MKIKRLYILIFTLFLVVGAGLTAFLNIRNMMNEQLSRTKDRHGHEAIRRTADADTFGHSDAIANNFSNPIPVRMKLIEEVRKDIEHHTLPFFRDPVDQAYSRATMFELDVQSIKTALDDPGSPWRQTHDAIGHVTAYVGIITGHIGTSSNLFEEIPALFSEYVNSSEPTHQDVLNLYGVALGTSLDPIPQQSSEKEYRKWEPLIRSPNPIYRAISGLLLMRMVSAPPVSSALWSAVHAETNEGVAAAWLFASTRSVWPTAQTLGFLESLRASSAGSRLAQRLEPEIDRLKARSR
jgi:hypothetical protein